MATIEAGETRPPGGTSAVRRVVLRLWAAGCVTILALLVGVRWLRYSSWSTASVIDGVVRELMVIDAQAFLWPWGYSRAKAGTVLLALLVLIVGLHRRLPAHCVEWRDGAWRLQPLVTALLLTGMVWFHYLLDLNPTVGGGCLVSLALATIAASPRVRAARPVWLVPVSAAAVTGWWLWIAQDAADRIAIATWVAILAASHVYVAPWLRRGDLVLLRALAIMPMNLLPAVLPLVIRLHSGTHLGDGLAYCFCESPDHRRLYATVPVCDSVRTDWDDCRDGHVAEYDLQTMTRAATHRFFSPDFYGRLEMMVCMDDEVQIGVQGTVYERRPLRQTVLSFSVASPASFNPLFATRVGAAIGYDTVHDALFYTGEFNHLIVRYDRRTKTSSTAGESLRRDWFEPVSLEPFSGSFALDTDSIHPARNRIYVLEWLEGSHAYGLDLATLEVIERHAVGSGGGYAIAVDPERDRLFVGSLWGLEVFDLASGRMIARKRMGVGNRPVVVDAARNRLYVSSTVDGKIRILDRDTFEVVGQIPIGVGSRLVHLSADGRHLFGSSVAEHYYWDADRLAPR